MGADSINTGTSIPGKLYLDGTEIYKEDGQTVFELETLTLEQLQELYAKLELDKKRAAKAAKNK